MAGASDTPPTLQRRNADDEEEEALRAACLACGAEYTGPGEGDWPLELQARLPSRRSKWRARRHHSLRMRIFRAQQHQQHEQQSQQQQQQLAAAATLAAAFAQPPTLVDADEDDEEPAPPSAVPPSAPATAEVGAVSRAWGGGGQMGCYEEKM
jgi:hypothetical protein